MSSEPDPDLIVDTDTLAALCERLASEPYVTVDTEFMREKTFWPILCLVQLGGENEARAVDALADGIDLAPLFDLMANRDVLKVFHAARQDIEIFHHLSGNVPVPVFDTQVAGMVCGFGDSVSYENLVSKLARERIDKSSRFTDWSARPLSKRQLDYALSDVTHLRVVYEKLRKKLEKSGRGSWLDAEMDILTSPETYIQEPDEAWRRIKIRSGRPQMLAILKEVTAWREREAQRRDLPRNRVLRDEALLDLAGIAPRTVEDLARIRGLGRGLAEGAGGKAILEAVARGLAVPDSEAPVLPQKPDLPDGLGPVIDLLKVVLKMKCESEGVAQKLVANVADLEQIAASDDADVAALSGWRRELFGNAALAIKHSELAVTIEGKKLVLRPVSAD